ncbi:hypothetical protein TH53_16735 [Pedobacter lusitanus]|uniref:Uncharacterized protein n=1 Tax=Pedobacter lusitanus TaxID=1503925 RepID=A0A0D0GFP3_9SPHI|nr:hypothetical protein [Pedobacter lusitanus]KIO76122.1 hypothetical protein TH53_16735 [Pedobacter lusitanus]
MELNDIKSTWNTTKTPEMSETAIQAMLSENKHPVLKGIRKQLTIELLGWGIFLSCYYTMFDGNLKPMWVNILLILSVLFPILHNLTGYRFAKYLIHGTSLRESLKNYLSKVKIYAVIAVISRQIYLTGLLLFFTYGLSFNTSRYLSLTVITLIFLVQLWLSVRLWTKRLNHLRNSLITFN